MSKPIEGVSEKIETCAKKEFLDKGYVDASLRTIAAEAGTTTGAIYSRYGGKEGLFSALVEPAAKEFTEIFVSVQEKFQKIEPEKQADYMYDHFEIFQLLVDGAYGTKFQNFVEHLVEIETEYTYRFMDATGIQMKEGERITKNFMHIMNKALFESFFEVVRHNMSKEEARRYICMLEKYHSAGWDVIYSNCY